ncbi:MAG: Gfo/Idh/MocA family oxidoreductase [Pseudomonadota bacterium]
MASKLRMGVIGIDHRHIYTMIGHMEAAGAELAGWATEGAPNTLDGFLKRFPDAPRVARPDTLLADPDIDLILTAAVPSDRAAIAVAAMEAGKDVLTDKPGCLTAHDLNRLKQTTAATGRIWSVDFSERFEVPAVTLASDLVASGEIGRVVQTLGIGPHRLNRPTRPDWFFDRARNGGILADIGSHQIDQFLHFTGAPTADIHLARAACTQEPGFQDFGEIGLGAGAAHGYIRLDWFTPNALPTWGDGRLFILGTEGTIELRKYIDVGGRPGGDHVFITNGTRSQWLDGSGAGLPFFARLLDDLATRGTTAMPKGHAFAVTELALKAQELAEDREC